MANSARMYTSIITVGFGFGADGAKLQIGDVVVFENERDPSMSYIGAILGWSPNALKGQWPAFAFTDFWRRGRPPLERRVKNFRPATSDEITVWKGQRKQDIKMREVRPPHVVRVLEHQKQSTAA